MFRAIVYENEMNGETHVALVMGDVRRGNRAGSRSRPNRERHVRHVRLYAGRSGGRDAGPLSKKFPTAKSGMVLYLRQRENNLDLVNQLRTYALMQEKSIDFQSAKRETGYGKLHDYGIGAQILKRSWA